MDTNAGYTAQRARIQTYFDKTALSAWKNFASDAPLSKIRATVKEGREAMRNQMLGALPNDLTGWRILDAGCGAGMMSIELARRGADVLGVDLSPQIIEFAKDTVGSEKTAGTMTFEAGDMMAAASSQFDAIMAMDCLIHYEPDDALEAATALAARTTQKFVFTVAPRTALLATMRAVGQFFPRSDRSPAIVPINTAKLAQDLAAQTGKPARALNRVSRGFYISQAMEVGSTAAEGKI